jgi:thiamine pyrophosphate-dependent acetolactate synthase large subunit-like protein
MGCAVALALGLAEARPDVHVVAVVGDGELLMGAGSLWSVAGIRPSNLTVVVLADGEYSITGGQPLPAPCKAAAVAQVLGIDARAVSTTDELCEALIELPRPSLLEAIVDDRVWPGPSPFVDPHEVRLSVRSRLTG